MSSIIPLNESKELHALDEIVANRFEEFFALNLATHPLSTDTKYLSVLSKIYNIDIVGLNEVEAREILNLFYELRKYAGTVHVLKKVLSVFFSEVVVDDRAGNFEFDLSMELQNDVSFEKLEKIKSLINRYKNVRSHLRNIILNYPNQEVVFKVQTMSVFGMDIYADTLLEHDFSSKDIFVQSGVNLKTAPQVPNTLLSHDAQSQKVLFSGANFKATLNTNTTGVAYEMNAENYLNYGLNYRVCFDTKSSLENLTTNINQKGGLAWQL